MSGKTHSEKDSVRPTSLETAARTRPLSIQEIMLRRQKKVASEAKKTKEGIQDNDKAKPNHLESSGYKSRKDLKDVPVEGSKKENIRDTLREDSEKADLRNTSRVDSKKDDLRNTSREVTKDENLKDRTKGGSKMDEEKDIPKVPMKDDQKDAPKKGSKKERSSIRSVNHSNSKDKDTHSSHKPTKSMSSRADESKDGNHGEIRARESFASRFESLKGAGKRWNNEIVNNDRMKERSEKLRRETKRKGHGFDDEKSSEVDRSILKKYDFARFQDSKHSTRYDERKEYAKMYHEEPRSKRRRSRSRDHDRERRDRSGSLSPREQRHGYHGRGHDNNSPYYLTDKLSRNHAETNRHRASENSEHNGGWRYESRLGGYSPRKRKTSPKDEQTTTKTAPPVNRSPEKKSATWDQPPTGSDHSNFVATLQPTINLLASSGSVSFAASKQKPATAPNTKLPGTSSSIDSVQLTQATRPLRSLHVENLPSSVTEDLLIGCLNDFLLSSGVNHIQRSKQPCLSCTINKEKYQAFVEFLTPEDATAAISFDGKSFNGSALKIRRPKEYVEMTNVSPKKPAEDIKVISDVVPDSAHKIFIAGISGVISSEMLMDIVSAFGQLAAYRFINNEDLGRRCAFLEYIDHRITSKACAGLNGMKLGGCTLTAVQVSPNPLEEAANEASPFYGIPESAKSLLEEPTKVLQLKNVFDQEEYVLLTKSELEEILEDIRIECARFGAVKSINAVGYPANIDNSTEEIIVKPADGSIMIQPTEHCVNDKSTEAVTCSSPNKSIVVPGHFGPTEIKDVDPISENQDHKGLDTFRECAAAAESDQHTDLDFTDARATVPVLDEHTEANRIDSMQANYHATAGGDHSAVGKEHAEPRPLEISSSATPGDVVERYELEAEEQGSNVHESCAEKVPVTYTKDDASVRDNNVLEAGSVLVEFMRTEAACMAAHCLHGRRFGNRTVSAGYAPHDIYLQRYPR